MNYTITLFHIQNLQDVVDLPFGEVLLQPEFCSKNGHLLLGDLPLCIKELKRAGKRIVLSCDLLYHDSEFCTFKEQIASIISDVDGVRFTDPGLGWVIKENFPELKLQFSLETNNFNWVGIKKWCEIFGDTLERVILSNQLSLSEISSFSKKRSIDIEIPGLKRLSLFYSKRKLIEEIVPNRDGKEAEVECASEDRPTQISTVVENQNGTFMFQDRDLFVLDQKETLRTAGVSFLTLCPYKKEHYPLFRRALEFQEWESKLKEDWPQKLTRGFLMGNQSHQQFKLLSNEFIQAEKQNQFGEVLESTKKSHLVIQLQRSLQLPTQVKFITPEGREVFYTIKYVQSLSGGKELTNPCPGIYSMPWVKYVVPASILV